MTAHVPKDALRHALFDPAVDKRRILGRVPGFSIDAEDLREAVAARMPDRPPTAADLDAAVRGAGGHRMRSGFADVVRATAGRPTKRPDRYWLSLVAYRQATSRRG